MNDNQPENRNWLQTAFDNAKTTEYALLIPLMAFLTLAIMGTFSFFLYDFFAGIAEQIPDVQVEEPTTKTEH